MLNPTIRFRALCRGRAFSASALTGARDPTNGVLLYAVMRTLTIDHRQACEIVVRVVVVLTSVSLYSRAVEG
jgi:hypothetical protein